MRLIGLLVGRHSFILRSTNHSLVSEFSSTLGLAKMVISRHHNLPLDFTNLMIMAARVHVLWRYISWLSAKLSPAQPISRAAIPFQRHVALVSLFSALHRRPTPLHAYRFTRSFHFCQPSWRYTVSLWIRSLWNVDKEHTHTLRLTRTIHRGDFFLCKGHNN